MYKIAVIVPSYSIEYSLSFINGVCDYFSNKEVKVILAQTKYPNSTVTLFDYQYWSNYELLQAEDIDAIIIGTGVYLSAYESKNVIDYLRKITNKPVISAGVDLGIPNSYTVTYDCKGVFVDIIEHLKNHHNCKKIAFMSANDTQSPEAIERYEDFLLAMKKNGLTFDESLLYEGGFTGFRAEAALKKVIKTKEDIKFDSIVCANDSMAVGVIKYLKSVGAECPKDFLVVGFDDAIVSRVTIPHISTINQNVEGLGYTAGKIVEQILRGEKVKKDTKVKLSIKYRQTCGCIPKENLFMIYLDEKLKQREDSFSTNVDFLNFSNMMQEKNTIITLMDMLKSSNTLRQLYYNLRFIVQQCDMSNMEINFYDYTMDIDSSDSICIPDHAECYISSETKTGANLFKPGITFNPHKTLFPSRSSKNESGIYILQPIFSGEQNYGFLTCKINGRKFVDYNVYLKILVTSISQAFEYTSKLIEAEELEQINTKLIKDNTSLSKQSRTDEVTGIFNRRGFLEYGQRSLDLMQEVNSNGVVFFADMDGLKTINDSYGHDMGDKAIKLQAKVLKSAFRKTDIVGRIGGDEFGVVAGGMRLADIEKTRLKINLLNQKISQENNLPFVLSISFGAVDLQKSSVLKKLLTEADKLLYKEKESRKKDQK